MGSYHKGPAGPKEKKLLWQWPELRKDEPDGSNLYRDAVREIIDNIPEPLVPDEALNPPRKLAEAYKALREKTFMATGALFQAMDGQPEGFAGDRKYEDTELYWRVSVCIRRLIEENRNLNSQLAVYKTGVAALERGKVIPPDLMSVVPPGETLGHYDIVSYGAKILVIKGCDGEPLGHYNYSTGEIVIDEDKKNRIAVINVGKEKE